MESLYSFLPASAIVTQESDPSAYKKLTTCWAEQLNLHPQVVVAPPDVQSLSKTVKYLYDCTDLDFTFRGNGYCSLPAKDVLVSMHKFDEFTHDSDNQTITVGAGQAWKTVYEKVDVVAPKYAVVGARTPSVSVGGTITTGGFSWLSGKLGTISDSQNMIDCEIVKYDGTVVWASSEPALLWAIRGGGGGFGAITRVVFQLHPISRKLYYGTVTAPMSALPEVASRVSKFSASSEDSGASLFMFIEKKKFEAMHGTSGQDDVIVFQLFDPNGAAHGRQTFSWVLDLPGAADFTREGSMLEVIGNQDRASELMGTSRQYWAAAIVPEFGASQLETCVKWFQDLGKYSESIAKKTYMVYELFCTNESPTPKQQAWPGPRGCKHMLIAGIGCDVDASEKEDQTARELAQSAPSLLTGHDPRITTPPNAVETWSDVSKIYGDNYKDLLELRVKYDPQQRFKGRVNAV
ncbi:FAD binding domain-containing protein [Trichoderma velutinum]